MSLFFSLTGFVLAIYGGVFGKKTLRCFSLSMVIILLVLAMGAYLPLFKFLYNWVPGFDKFRGNSKFIFHATMFLALLSGIGLDSMLKYPRSNRVIIIVMLVSGLLAGILGMSIYNSAALGTKGLWGTVMSAVASTQETSLPPPKYRDDAFVMSAGIFAAKGMFICGGTFLLLSVLLFLKKFSWKFTYLIALLAILEVFTFARAVRPVFNLNTLQLSKMQKFYAEHPGDYRVSYIKNLNSAMSNGLQDIWGYSSLVLRRYAQFMTFTQGKNPDKANMYLNFSRFSRLYSMIRFRYLFISGKNKLHIQEFEDAMPRVQLIRDWVVIQDRDDIFAAMNNPEFDPRQKVILENEPDPMPVKSEEKGFVKLINYSTDHLDVEVNLPKPAVMLITNNYSRGWRASALSGNTQQNYNIVPANYFLQAVSLNAGAHRIRIEYLPLAFRIGKWISIISIIIYISLLAWVILKYRYCNL